MHFTKSLVICFCVAVATGHMWRSHIAVKWNLSGTEVSQPAEGALVTCFHLALPVVLLNTRHLVLFTQVGSNELHVFIWHLSQVWSVLLLSLKKETVLYLLRAVYFMLNQLNRKQFRNQDCATTTLLDGASWSGLVIVGQWAEFLLSTEEIWVE